MNRGSIPTIGSCCPQCGTMHPLLRHGEVCPMAMSKKIVETSGRKIDVSDLSATLSNILISQILKKDIKDIKKIKTYIIVEMTKLLECYKE